MRAASKSPSNAAKSQTPSVANRFSRARFAGGRPPKALEFFFDAGGLLLPCQLFGKQSVAFGQLLETLIGFDPGDDGVEFLRATRWQLFLPCSRRCNRK